MTISSPQIRQHAGEELINEAGIYLLMLTAQTDVGKQVRSWLYEEVIPAVMKTGGYRLMGVAPHVRQRGNRTSIPGSKTKSDAIASVQLTEWMVEELLPSIIRTGGYCLKGRSVRRSEEGGYEHPPMPDAILDALYDHFV